MQQSGQYLLYPRYLLGRTSFAVVVHLIEYPLLGQVHEVQSADPTNRQPGVRYERRTGGSGRREPVPLHYQRTGTYC